VTTRVGPPAHPLPIYCLPGRAHPGLAGHGLHTADHVKHMANIAAAMFTGIARVGRAGPQLVGAAADLAARNWFMGAVKSGIQPKSGSRRTGPHLVGAITEIL
jgi:hypothetical protein